MSFVFYTDISDSASCDKLWSVASQDVAWHMKNEFLFGSVGDDKMVFIWDTRVSPQEGA